MKQEHSRPEPTTLAEQAVLGALMLDAGARQRVNDLCAEHFASEAHRAIFAAIIDVIEAGGSADVVTVYERLRSAGKDKEAGGLDYLNSLATNTPSAANVSTYAALVKKGAERRKLALALQSALEVVDSEDEEATARALARVTKLAEAKQAPPSALPAVLDLAALAQTEPASPASLIEGGGLPCGEVALLSSNGGLGKSFIALTLGVCLAAGKPYFGLTVQRRRTYFLSLEDQQDQLHWRVRCICTWLGVDLEMLARDGWLTIADGSHADAELYSDWREGAGLTHVYEWLAREMRSREVLILDGISDAYGGDEIRRRQVRAFVRAVRRLVPPHGSALLLGHVNAATARAPDTTQGYSGSTAWNNSVRARWYLRKEDQSDEDLLLELQKANNARSGMQIRLRWLETAHVFAGEAVLPAGRLERELAEFDERDALLQLIADAQESGDPVPAASTGSRTSWSVMCQRTGFPTALVTTAGKRRFREHLEKLRAAGRVKVAAHTTVGRKKREVLHAT